MICTITYITNEQPGQDGRAHKRGQIPRKPVQWIASVWMIAPGGEKTTHSITVLACTAPDLIPAIGERIDDLARENGQLCVQFGWTASAHGVAKQKGGKR